MNGEQRQVPDGVTVLGLLDILKIQPQRVAVELNREIVKKDRYGITAISEGDNIEVVSFMSGGQQSSGFRVNMRSREND